MTISQKTLACLLALMLVTLPAATACAQSATPEVLVYDDFDVVIAGGSTAAFAAAIASAKSGARTALIEPTDWVGGQLTSSGVPAVDEAWHTITDKETGKPLLSVAKLARDPKNITPNFLSTLTNMKDCGDCWVSRFCFRPQEYLRTQLLPLQEELGDKLVVFTETVVKRVELDPTGSKIKSLLCIRRIPQAGISANGYDRLPSEDLPDWYSEQASERYKKEILLFNASGEKPIVFIEATEWGEILALSNMEYLQGVEYVDGERGGNDSCGQSTVYCFVQELHAEPQEHPATRGNPDNLGLGDYSEKPDAWNLIWTYRRIRGNEKPAPGDLCLQNWGYSGKLNQGGNDYPFGYLFKSREATAGELHDWQGGINLETLAGAEQRALGWHEWFRHNAPSGIDPDQITLAGEELGTGHGLAKLPYIRDTRRAIGLDGYILKFEDLTGPAEQQTGTVFPDRIALGAYPADVHPLADCKLPAYLQGAHDTLPFYIPFRALTHYRLENLLVAGKTMAQSFLTNSATRLHPTEWSSGTAAGVAAAHMARTGKTAQQTLDSINELQQLVKKFTPIDWSFPLSQEK
ncbi:MAG: FAD-dependent oxidoreductase [Bythopirellula sp.]|nr:FAD-dependent oxidoreductase [Bythopirellula sp.]